MSLANCFVRYSHGLFTTNEYTSERFDDRLESCSIIYLQRTIINYRYNQREYVFNHHRSNEFIIDRL